MYPKVKNDFNFHHSFHTDVAVIRKHHKKRLEYLDVILLISTQLRSAILSTSRKNCR